jgi:UDP-4-amino-4,6-dideoxy-N-acetyl-beta-L-altrosamine transaminase
VPAFEGAIAARAGAGHAVAVNSATSALHIACMALDLGPGDLLWTVPNTFVASANVGLYCGADVDFVDIDPETYLMCPNALRAKLEQAKRLGRLPKVIIPVHFAGQTADMVAIGALARAYGVRVIEDASHSIGASYRGVAVGACPESDVTVFSFHPVKIITTAEGGCATTNDPELARRMVLGRSHGVTRDQSQMQDADGLGGWYYEQIALGYNYRMTDIQAALGLSQMARLDDFIARRHVLAKRYDALLAGLDVVCPVQCPHGHSALHLYPVQVRNRAQVFAALRDSGVGVNVHYIPVHTHPYWRAKGFAWGDFPNAEAFYQGAISLPLHTRLTEKDQDQVVAALALALDRAS